MAVVETTLSMVDDALPCSRLFYMLFHLELAVHPKHSAPDHGPVFLPRLCRQPHRELLHSRPSGHRVGVWCVRHRLLRKCVLPPRWGDRVYVHGYRCIVPCASKSMFV